MPCLARNIIQRSKLYGGDVATVKDISPSHGCSYGSDIFRGIPGPIRTPTSRVAEYSYGQRRRELTPVAQNRCAVKWYGGPQPKDKQWIWVKLTEESKPDIRELFAELSRRWREDIGMTSSLSDVLGNINYLRVIALGKKAIPLLLEELQHEPAPWFTALEAITGENPSHGSARGDFRAMAHAWVEWGRARGFVDGDAIAA